ncbi:EF-hand calcium-binding domain-containing protein 5 [Cladochytrium tenue]|nr:EF-hand calcium-binding domain-containing protein 5 [Cladochytrium tenue]
MTSTDAAPSSRLLAPTAMLVAGGSPLSTAAGPRNLSQLHLHGGSHHSVAGSGAGPGPATSGGLASDAATYALPVHQGTKVRVDLGAIRAGTAPAPGTGTARSYRDVAMALVANDFLAVADINLETRAFLVETVMPTVIISLEKLLIEAEKQGMLDGRDGALRGEIGKTVAPAAEKPSLESQQRDRPKTSTFEPVNWLAQYLYRNNPRFSNFSEASSSPYQQQMAVIARQLKSRLFEMQVNQRARRRAEELASRREEERRNRSNQHKMSEMRSQFEKLLVEVFRSAAASDIIFLRDSLLEKVTELNTHVAKTVEEAEQERLIGDAQGGLSLEHLSLEKWDQSTFVEAMLTLTYEAGWTVDELAGFLQAVSFGIDDSARRLHALFDAAFFCPTFPKDAGDLSRRRQLLKLLVNATEADPENGRLLALRIDVVEYCNTGSPELVAAGKAAMAAAEGGHRRTSTVTRRTSTVEATPISSAQEGDTATAPEVAEAHAFIEEFRAAMAALTGLHGLSPATWFMSELRTQANGGGNERNDHGEGAVVETEEARARAVADVMRAFDERGDGTFNVLRYNEAVNAFMAGDVAAASFGMDAGSVLAPFRVAHDVAGAEEGEGGAVFAPIAAAAAAVARQVGISAAMDPDSVLVDQFTGVARLLGEAASGVAAATAAVGASGEGGGMAIGGRESVLASKAATRAEIQMRALASVRATLGRHDLSVADAARVALEAAAGVLRELHPFAGVVHGRVSIAERAVTRVDADALAREGTAVGGAGGPPAEVVETLLRFVAAIPAADAGRLVGATTAEVGGGPEGLEEKVMGDGSTVVLEDARGKDHIGTKLLETRSREGTEKEAHSTVVGVPLKAGDGHSVGVFAVTISIGELDKADIEFLESVSAEMLAAFSRIDARIKAINMASSSVAWARSTGDAEVDIYLNEPVSWEHPPRFFEVVDQLDNKDGKESETLSPFMKQAGPLVKEIDPSSAVHDLLSQTARTREMVNYDESDGRTSTYIPVMDEATHVVAVMRLRPRKGQQGPVPDDDVSEVRRVVEVLETCVNEIQKQSFGDADPQAGQLAGEAIDEESRRRLLFPKMMLMKARDFLSKLDSRSIFELRSYKKPPLNIHKVLKAVLYIFGYLPKDAIPHGDVRSKGSLPAMLMYEWLLVTLDLRERAVEARQRRADVFSLVAMQDVGDGEADDEVDEAGVAGDDGASTVAGVSAVEDGE